MGRSARQAGDERPFRRRGRVKFWQILVTSGQLQSWLVHYLFLSAKKVQEVSVDLVVLDRAKLEPMFSSDLSLLTPARE